MTHQNKKQFLEKLQEQAQLQARLNSNRFLPTQLDSFTSFFGRYPWQVLLVASGITSLGIEVLSRI